MGGEETGRPLGNEIVEELLEATERSQVPSGMRNVA